MHPCHPERSEGPLRQQERSLAALGMTMCGWSTSLESRLPLLHEGAAAFLVVVAVEAGLCHRLELLVVLLGFGLGDFARRCLGEGDGERGILANGAGDA